jgi:hypothetical protein
MASRPRPALTRKNCDALERLEPYAFRRYLRQIAVEINTPTSLFLRVALGRWIAAHFVVHLCAPRPGFGGNSPRR